MKKIQLLIAGLIATMAVACGGAQEQPANSEEKKADVQSMYPEEKPAEEADPQGVGKFKDVVLAANLDAKLAEKGLGVYDLKCSACHRLEGDRLVGPSWKGVTERRQPAWILNFITNVDEMLSKDPAAMAQLEECLVRMPNQNLSDDEALAVLEYMRKNDGVQ
jgi:mono/diheme cytochrome c family protein